jgi:two-component system phosphate regulon sensor histidine kinase PhoR
MRSPRLFWKLFIAFTVTTLLVLVLLIALITQVHGRFAVKEQQAHLEVLARLVIREVQPRLELSQRKELRDVLSRWDEMTGARMTVILPDGEVIADSRRDVAAMYTHAGRPEIMEALAGHIGHARRYSTSTRMRMLYVAQPLEGPAGLAAVVRLALPDQTLQAMERSLRWQVFLAAAFMVVLAGLVSAGLSRQLRRPLEAMRRVADHLADGSAGTVDWPSPGTREVAALAEALRRMSGRLHDKISDVEELLAEQRAVFSSMVDGVLLVDRAERVVDLNRAAATWFGCQADLVRGREVLEVVRHPRLEELVKRTLAGPGPVEGDLLLHGPRELSLQVHGASVRDGTGRVAAVLVLTDVTRLREVEKAHRDFVANASHELKTPVTSIKGFAETLTGDDIDPIHTKRFAGILARQADQLSALIEDLLELTRLEHQDERAPLERERAVVSSIVRAAVETCSLEAHEKNITLSVRCPEDLSASVHVSSVQRALTNLIDNAIKYSPAQTTVTVEAMAEREQLVLRVSDQGPGIAPEHQARIFERFYRVDKSRSRKLGGTGLGLSIVRHAAQAHGGTVIVQSTLGQGSTFLLRIPLAGKNETSKDHDVTPL